MPEFVRELPVGTLNGVRPIHRYRSIKICAICREHPGNIQGKLTLTSDWCECHHCEYVVHIAILSIQSAKCEFHLVRFDLISNSDFQMHNICHLSAPALKRTFVTVFVKVMTSAELLLYQSSALACHQWLKRK
jgi:hypothetical protein